MPEIHLFHSIGAGGEDSAIVRKYIVDHNLKDKIEFHNTMYEGSQKLIREMSGQTQAPCLVAGEEVLVGKDKIIPWLRANLD